MRKAAHSVLLVGKQRLDWGLGGGSECQLGCSADITPALPLSLQQGKKKKKRIKKSGGLTDHTPPPPRRESVTGLQMGYRKTRWGRRDVSVIK